MLPRLDDGVQQFSSEAASRLGLNQAIEEERQLKRFFALVAIVAIAYAAHSHYAALGASAEGVPTSVAAPQSPAGEVSGTGTVIKLLPDDNEGARHQRFIIRLASGQTLLVAHNIEIAARVSPLREGDTVAYKGEYAWNAKGGVVHWTHHDPAGTHPAGWLKHDGHTFQ